MSSLICAKRLIGGNSLYSMKGCIDGKFMRPAVIINVALQLVPNYGFLISINSLPCFSYSTEKASLAAELMKLYLLTHLSCDAANPSAYTGGGGGSEIYSQRVYGI
jgi:hypothetical protein